MNGRPWTDEEIATLRRRFPHEKTERLAHSMGRSLSSVYGIAYKLGLQKTEAYLASPDACRLRRGGNVGAAHRFIKGQVPANKGLRRPGWSPGRMSETQFRPGERSGIAAKNWCPIGTVRPDAEGYLRIKVREAQPGEATGFGNTKVWVLLQRQVWEQAHGPVPPKHAVVFRDGNRAHCELDNLELVPRAELMRRNTIHNLPKDLVEVIQLTGAIKRKIREKHAAEQTI